MADEGLQTVIVILLGAENGAGQRPALGFDAQLE